jgi:predicted HTH domain antitoxin
MKVLSVRLDEDLERKLSFLMKKLKIIDRSTYIRQLLEKSLSEEMLEVLCKQVEEKQISAWKAAEIAGISLRKMLYELKKRNFSGYDEQSLKEDLEFALE